MDVITPHLTNRDEPSEKSDETFAQQSFIQQCKNCACVGVSTHCTCASVMTWVMVDCPLIAEPGKAVSCCSSISLMQQPAMGVGESYLIKCDQLLIEKLITSH